MGAGGAVPAVARVMVTARPGRRGRLGRGAAAPVPPRPHHGLGRAPQHQRADEGDERGAERGENVAREARHRADRQAEQRERPVNERDRPQRLGEAGGERQPHQAPRGHVRSRADAAHQHLAVARAERVEKAVKRRAPQQRRPRAPVAPCDGRDGAIERVAQHVRPGVDPCAEIAGGEGDEQGDAAKAGASREPRHDAPQRTERCRAVDARAHDNAGWFTASKNRHPLGPSRPQQPAHHALPASGMRRRCRGNGTGLGRTGNTSGFAFAERRKFRRATTISRRRGEPRTRIRHDRAGPPPSGG